MAGKKRGRCGICMGCKADECQVCTMCLDKPKYGGPGKKKQCCIKRKCLHLQPSNQGDKKTQSGKILSMFSIAIMR